MKYRLTSVTIAFALFFLSSCKNENVNPFLIEKNNIGLLTDSTKVKDIEAIFINDSVVKRVAGDEFSGSSNRIDIFKKDGTKLLELSPKDVLDSTSTISTIQILDKSFKTKANITKESTFKEIKEAYKVSKIDNLINIIVVSVNEINASFAIDKKELPISLQFDTDAVIDPIQIPDTAKIKYFMLHW